MTAGRGALGATARRCCALCALAAFWSTRKGKTEGNNLGNRLLGNRNWVPGRIGHGTCRGRSRGRHEGSGRGKEGRGRLGACHFAHLCLLQGLCSGMDVQGLQTGEERKGRDTKDWASCLALQSLPPTPCGPPFTQTAALAPVHCRCPFEISPRAPI